MQVAVLPGGTVAPDLPPGKQDSTFLHQPHAFSLIHGSTVVKPLQVDSEPMATTDRDRPYTGICCKKAGVVKIVLMAGTCEAVVETWESRITDPLRTLVTLNKLLGSLRRACTPLSNSFVSSLVQEDRDLSATRNTNSTVVATEADVSGGAGLGVEGGGGAGLAVEGGGGAGLAVVGAGGMRREVDGDGSGLLQSLEVHDHVEGETHCPSFDPEADPLLQVPEEEHQPQPEASVQVLQTENELQMSSGALSDAKAVQLKADKNGSF